MRKHKWAEEPTPHGALVIRAVALATIAAIMPLVAGFGLCQTAQSVRGNQAPGTNIDNCFLLFRRKRALWQRNGKNLVWPENGVISNFWRVDDVVAVSARFIPEFAEALFYALRQLCEGLGGLFCRQSETSHGFQRIKPQCIDLNGLSDSWRHYPVADFRIHPGELNAGFAGVKQAIGLVNVNLI